MNRIVILGGGFAGISAKLYYPKSILIDFRETFSLTPKYIDLIEGKGLDDARLYRKVDVKAYIKKIDFKEKRVITTEGSIKYDKLIIALGFRQDLSRIKGAERFALKYETIEDVITIREKLSKSDRIIVMGGGLLGVELAGTLRFKKEVILIEADKRILPFLPHEVSNYAQKVLESYGVNIINNAIIEGVKENEVLTSQGVIKGELKIFAAGFIGPNIVSEVGLTNVKNRMIVDQFLRSVDFEDVYGAGDCATFKDSFIPQSAQIALQAGEVAMMNALGKDVPFKPKQRALVFRIGEEYLGLLGNKFVRGSIAKVVKELAIKLMEGRIRRLNSIYGKIQIAP